MSRDDRTTKLAMLSLCSTTATMGAVLALTAFMRYDWLHVALGLGIAWFAGRCARGAYVELRDEQ